MSASTLPNATLTAAYEAMTPGSAALAAKARAVLPSGLAHDSRHFDPYPLYVSRALGPVKWDVDGNKYVDYFGGHGALILGHNHPDVTAGDPRRARPRHPFRRLPRRGNPLGGADYADGALGGTGALHLLRHRGDADGAAPGARLHRAVEAGAVPRPLPRLERPHDQRAHQPFRRHRDQRRGGRRVGQRSAVRPERCRRHHPDLQRPHATSPRSFWNRPGRVSGACRSSRLSYRCCGI